MHVAFDYWSNSSYARVKRWDQDLTGDFSDTLNWNGAGFDVASQAGATSAKTNGTSSVPPPSITAERLGASFTWLVAGQYFTPGQRVEAFLYEPPNSPSFSSADAPGVFVRMDGTFTGNFELASHPGPAMIKACDFTFTCATVTVSAP